MYLIEILKCPFHHSIFWLDKRDQVFATNNVLRGGNHQRQIEFHKKLGKAKAETFAAKTFHLLDFHCGLQRFTCIDIVVAFHFGQDVWMAVLNLKLPNSKNTDILYLLFISLLCFLA